MSFCWCGLSPFCTILKTEVLFLDYSVHILNVLYYIFYIVELFRVKIFLYEENPLRALSGLKSNNQAKIIYPQKDEKT